MTNVKILGDTHLRAPGTKALESPVYLHSMQGAALMDKVNSFVLSEGSPGTPSHDFAANPRCALKQKALWSSFDDTAAQVFGHQRGMPLHLRGQTIHGSQGSGNFNA